MKIAVLVSGGVDSSVALQLLKQQGHELTAFYLKIWLEDELAFLGDCPWQEDLAYVQAVCKQLDVPLEVISLQKEYWERVVAYTIAQVQAGRTPNPDVLCNQRVKFGSFYDKIDASFDKVASGHYASVVERDGIFLLYQAPDAIKDQTYFLSQLSQEQLARALFPIGTMNKSEVRALAHEYNLANKDRKDSQGICFLGKLKFDEFLKFHLGEKQGDLIEVETGEHKGTHSGFWYYTIGQRHGIGLAGGPWYVVDKDTTNNIVYISRDYYSPQKARNVFDVEQLHWIAGQAPAAGDIEVKIRHGSHTHRAQINYLNEHSLRVTLAERDQGIAPGQYAVFYKEGQCLGGGVIQSVQQ